MSERRKRELPIPAAFFKAAELLHPFPPPVPALLLPVHSVRRHPESTCTYIHTGRPRPSPLSLPLPVLVLPPPPPLSYIHSPPPGQPLPWISGSPHLASQEHIRTTIPRSIACSDRPSSPRVCLLSAIIPSRPRGTSVRVLGILHLIRALVDNTLSNITTILHRRPGPRSPLPPPSFHPVGRRRLLCVPVLRLDFVAGPVCLLYARAESYPRALC